MIVLDTNVFSELGRDEPDEAVARWAEQLDIEEVHLTAISRAEVLTGLAIMPAGRRRTSLAERERARLGVFAERTLSFDLAAADLYAEMVATRRGAGHPISAPDAQIAAIAKATGATLATRNVGDFEGVGVTVVNPWDDDAP